MTGFEQMLARELGDRQGGELHVVYQPIACNRTLEIAGFEALARWTHPSMGNISPSRFIPAAEKAGMVSEITHAVLDTALKDCKDWDGKFISVNLSPQDLADSKTPAVVEHLLDRHDINPSRLNTEITETMAIDDMDHASSMMETMRCLGVGTALDDFGVGYGTMERVNALPLDKVKLDRSLVKDIAHSDAARMRFEHVIGTLSAKGYSTVVEGIETESQLAIARRSSACDYLQGYAIARPMAADLIPAFIAGSRIAARRRNARLPKSG